MKMMRNFGILLSVTLIACQANAQQPGVAGKTTPPSTTKSQPNPEPLEVKLVRSRVVLVDGKEILQSAVTAKPGEILEEVATYTNKSKSPLKSLEATLPIPPNTELLMSSVRPGNAKASTDGREFFMMPLKRKVRQASGVEVEQSVPLSEYRYLRWYAGDLAAEKSLVFSARFKVSNDETPAVSPAGK